jgi:hypothetical protein
MPMAYPLPLIGFEREQRVLEEALCQRRSLLLLGCAGSGKTALLDWACRRLRHSGVPVYVPRFETPHDLLLTIARELFRHRHAAFQRLACADLGSERWLEQQTSSRLRGLMWQAFEQEPATILLDHLNRPGHVVYRFLQRLYYTPGMVLVAAARDQAHLGELRRLFWDPRHILHIQPLSGPEARRLFQAAAEYFNLNGLELEDFRRKVLESAKGNPGDIVEMCRLASDPRYRSGTHIEFSLIRIELKMLRSG